MSDALSLYLHVPFCSTRCGYCHFNTYEGLERLFEPFAAALCAESAGWAQRVGAQSMVRTIFLGGGTPTHLPLPQFTRIMHALREQWAWAADIEITSEANPTNITRAYLDGMLAAGINRLSFGAQRRRKRLEQALEAFIGVEMAVTAARRTERDVQVQAQVTQFWSSSTARCCGSLRRHCRGGSAYRRMLAPQR